jgi:hypothetical protein
MTKVITLNGKLINVGEWDYCVEKGTVAMNPWESEGEAPEDWDYQYQNIEVETNPLPGGAIEQDVELVESAKGRLLLSTDWYNLREDAYPPIKDQLDAAWKGGEEAEAMKQLVLSIKDKYPKLAEE